MTICIKDIATAAGVSIATVSRVLSGKSVRPAYRARVEAALKGLDYRPNLAARRLRAPTTGAIGLIVPDLANPFFTNFVREVEDLAWKEGLRVMICDSDEDSARESMRLRMLKDERVSGLIIAPAGTSQGLGDDATPTVLFDRVDGNGLHDLVALDNETAASSLTERLHGDGVRRILGLVGDAGSTALARERGFAAYTAAHGIDLRIARIPFPADARREAIWQAITDAPGAEAIMATNSDILLEAAIFLGPRTNLMLSCFDPAPWSRLFAPRLRVVMQPVAEMAHAALAMLVERIAGHDGPPRHVTFRGGISAEP